MTDISAAMQAIATPIGLTFNLDDPEDRIRMASFWTRVADCPIYCPCRWPMNERGEHPRNEQRCPYEAAADQLTQPTNKENQPS